MRSLSLSGFLACFLLWTSCSKDAPDKNFKPGIMEIPPGFPQMNIPADNQYTQARWKLGKKLFYDPILSRDGKISCASCHDPRKAFSDSVSVSPGSDGFLGTRNSPTLTNIGYHPYFMREGGVPTLEMQVLVPLEEKAEFNHHVVEITRKLENHTEYRELAFQAYGQPINPYVITRAIANFERSLISGNSPFDTYRVFSDDKALSDDAKSGMQLFFSDKTNCSVCHAGFNFTNYSFQNNGLYQNYSDPGRQRLTHNPADHALFKVPTLRNVKVTAPYMHDGSIKSLEDVIEHYNSGGKSHPQKSFLIKPLGLSAKEKYQLLIFLESLTDSEFIQNQNFRN